MTIDDIKARRENITEGRWNCFGVTLHAGQKRLITGRDHSIPVWFIRWADAIFCACAPADIDWLVAEVERLEKELDNTHAVMIRMQRGKNEH